MARNPITIEVLETLDAIDRRGSFAKAADELNKATSAVSYAIQKLEDQLDIALFQRQGRRSILTPAGQLVLEEGRDILQTTARLANKAKEVATGWEPRINIAVESLQPYPAFFRLLGEFLAEHPSIEIDVRESVLNGGWEALGQGRVDLIVGSPGPVPLQRGYRVIPLPHTELLPVIAGNHPLAKQTENPESLQAALPEIRRVISHDTSQLDVPRSKGLSDDGRVLYVQTIDQKVEAIVAGIGIGHLPRHRIEEQLRRGELIALDMAQDPDHESFVAWKIGNKGRGLRALTQKLTATL